ncbi:MAG: 3-dehydroquinate synthase [Desulfobaccales bacterium]
MGLRRWGQRLLARALACGLRSAAIKTIHQEFQVSFRYPVHFTSGLFDLGNPLFHEVIRDGGGDLPKKLLAVVDRGLYHYHPGLPADLEEYCRAHAEVIALTGAPLLLPGGEAVKNDPLHVTILHQAILAAGLCRHSYVAAIGGGALIDTVGLVAATAHRGVRLIRVPTTVLAQADAAIGVKNSVNAMGQKNFLGVFTPPAAVLNDSRFLTTLSQKDWIGGVAEAVKVALIKDAAFFAFLERQARGLARRDLQSMRQVIYRCAALHLDHIASGGDPFEHGSSRPLDFGHWAAHRLELLSGFELGHGEAVAIGLALDTTYSYLAGLLGERPWRRVLNLLTRLGFALYVPQLDNEEAILRGLEEFRTHLGGRLTILLLSDIGRGLETNEIDPGTLGAALEELRGFAPAVWPAVRPALAS